MTATPPPPPQNPNYAATTEMSPSDQRLWSTLTHVGGILFGFLAPLITYLVLKDRGPFVRAHTATALNFQLTLLIAYVAGYILTFILIGILVLFAAWVASIVFGIIAAIAANKGEFYTYPVAIKFLS
ncbi:MAG TPA: DUF4870 domain-containing protein [Protaetiibacter sp.]|nr:DUF4870 domain-containing protein [Protaetiibacter sp.]